MSLYKIGDSYFVADDNHRVSVRRYHGVELIDVEVTEFPTSTASLMVALETLGVPSCFLEFTSWTSGLFLYAETRGF